MAANKKLELRLAPAEGTQLYRVFHYLLRNTHLVGDGRSKAAEAITAFWLPFALEPQSEDPQVLQRVARDCVLILEQHIYLLRRTFDLDLPMMPNPIQTTPEPATVPMPQAPETPTQPDNGFNVHKLDANLLFDDE